MIKIISYQANVGSNTYIQRLVNMLNIENGKVIINVQNGRFVHLVLQPSYTPKELDATEVDINEINKEKT